MTKKCAYFTEFLAVSMLAACAVLSGCQADGTDDMKAIDAAFERGDYKTAYSKSTRIVMLPTSTPDNAGHAMYMAGMSAFRLNDLPNAQMYLERAIQSSDPRLVANARAMLGLVSTQQGLYDKAAENLVAAAEAMEGQDKANAYFYAGAAQQKSGRWPQARVNLSMALSYSKDEGFRQKVREQLKITGYTLQLGAFSSEDAGGKLAARYAAKAAELKLGAPRVVKSTDPDGKTLHLVQVGQFTSFPTAIMWRDKLGVSNAIVAGLTN